MWTAIGIDPYPLPGAVPAVTAVIDVVRLAATTRALRDAGARLVSLWGSDVREEGEGFLLHLVFATAEGLLWLRVPLPAAAPTYPDLSECFPVAARLQRAAFDLTGITAADAADQRPWLRHGAWGGDRFPLRTDFVPGDPEPAPYPIVTVTGAGVHEIAVGPVHAGIIEPGHFRFQVVGEKILRLEARLGYAHKGIERRFIGLDATAGARLAGRISGDSTVAYAWAYAQAVESAAGIAPPPRALWVRALLLERERIANHLGDLGAIGNDAGLAFALSQFSRLKEDVLRDNDVVFGHRSLMDVVRPGGVACELLDEGAAYLLDDHAVLLRELDRLQEIYSEHPGLQDRFLTTGTLNPARAARLGVVGLAGRASGQAYDLRTQFPCTPYMDLAPRIVTRAYGDVAARVTVRFEELRESLRLCGRILGMLPNGPHQAVLPAPQPDARGIGWIEGWRGEVMVAVEFGADGRLKRVRPHDPSWQNWPALEHAVIGNIVPDFPLINKSFNLSYSGHDL